MERNKNLSSCDMKLQLRSQTLQASYSNMHSDDEINEYSTADKAYKLDPLISMINVVILESCRDEVDLLNSPYRKAWNEKKHIAHIPIDKRFGFYDDVILEQNMQNRLDSSQSEFSRLDHILNLLKDLLEYGISDLLVNRSCSTIFQAVKNIQTMNDDEFELISNFKSNYDLNSKLTDESLTDKLEAQDHIREVELKIYNVKREYEAFLQEAAMKYYTVWNWERSRWEQNLHLHKMKKNECEKSINDRKHSMRDEKIASSEMLKFYMEHIKDLKEDISKWITKYDEDMDATDLSITRQRIEVEEMQTQLRLSQQQMLTRDKEMRDWIELKTRRKEVAIDKYLRERASMKIQRWWRNILQERRKNIKKKKKTHKRKSRKY